MGGGETESIQTIGGGETESIQTTDGVITDQSELICKNQTIKQRWTDHIKKMQATLLLIVQYLAVQTKCKIAIHQTNAHGIHIWWTFVLTGYLRVNGAKEAQFVPLNSDGTAPSANSVCE